MALPFGLGAISTLRRRLVHWCSQQRGYRHPLEDYTMEDLKRAKKRDTGAHLTCTLLSASVVHRRESVTGSSGRASCRDTNRWSHGRAG